MLNTLYALSHLRFIITCDASSTFIPNLKIRKLKHREMKWFAKGHRADGWVSTDSKRIEFRNCPLNHYNGSKHHSFLSQGLHTCYSSCLEQFPLDCPMDPSSSSFSVWGIVQEEQEVESPLRAQSVRGARETSKRMVGKELGIWLWHSGRGVKSSFRDGNKCGYLRRGMRGKRKFWLLQDGEHPGPEKDLPMAFNLASDYFLITLVKTKSLSITELCLILGS